MYSSPICIPKSSPRAVYESDSSSISPQLKCHYRWTNTDDLAPDQASSLQEAQWMLQRAKDRRAKTVLDIGCYTGLSAIAWYEGTKETLAKIYTVEHNPHLAVQARNTFEEYGCTDRIKVIEGRAQDVLLNMTEPFDIIFIDLDFADFQPIVKQIIQRDLLSRSGIILVDNVFARGFAPNSPPLVKIDPAKLQYWQEAGKIVNDFNNFVTVILGSP